MKYIKKNQPPQNFIKWKNQANEDWQPAWNNFQKPEKTSVHDSLLKEQGFICCYCGKRINLTDSHIEHLKPRNQYLNLALDYNNFLASCEIDKEEPPPIPVHCGHKKAGWYQANLMVSPLNSNCADFFRYPDDGQILPTTDLNKKAAAKETINKLALDIDKLRKMRKAAIEGILDVINTLNNNDIQMLINSFGQPNTNGEYEEFCSSIIYVLRKYL